MLFSIFLQGEKDMSNRNNSIRGFIVHLKLTYNNINTLFNSNYRIFYPRSPITLKFDKPTNTKIETPYSYTDFDWEAYGFNVGKEDKEKYTFLTDEFKENGKFKYMEVYPIDPENFHMNEQFEIIFEKGFRCRLSSLLLQHFKIIFIDTYIKYINGEKWNCEDSEGADLYFFPDKRMMFMGNIKLRNKEENSYEKFIRNTIRFQPINDTNSKLDIEDGIEDDIEDNAKEFEKQMFSKESQWFEERELNNINVGMVEYAIYMLWDYNSKHFYVGKAKDLRIRLDQHKKSSNGPIPKFTHFRYSILKERYREQIYMFEMHEIHTAGWILSAPNAKNSRLQALPNCKCEKCANSISMINTLVDYHSPQT